MVRPGRDGGHLSLGHISHILGNVKTCPLSIPGPSLPPSLSYSPSPHDSQCGSMNTIITSIITGANVICLHFASWISAADIPIIAPLSLDLSGKPLLISVIINEVT